MSGLQAEASEKSRALEAVMAQLERAELKAAKEARKRMDLERLMKRLDSSFDQLMLGSNAGAAAAAAAPGVAAGAGKASNVACGGLGGAAPPPQPPAFDAGLSVDQRMRMRGWGQSQL